MVIRTKDDFLWFVRGLYVGILTSSLTYYDVISRTPDRPDGRIDLRTKVPKEPMSWVISAISMSRNFGLGYVTQPARVSGLGLGETVVIKKVTNEGY